MGVNDVSFHVQPGEIFVVMGLSGSGKSTLIRCLNRLIEPTSGTVKFGDVDVTAASADELREIRRTKVAMVFQHFALLPHRSVIENVEYGLKVRDVDPKERREKAVEALDLVGLAGWEEYRPDNLSGGMRQRVGLARALASDPEILLMDEAFSALDPLIKREMQDELLAIQEKLGKTILFITHDLNEALKLGDRTAIMRDGAVVQVGTSQQIITRPNSEYIHDFTRDVDRGRVLSLRSVIRKAGILNDSEATVTKAHTLIEEADGDLDCVLLVRDGKPVGYAGIEDLQKATDAGQDDLSAVVWETGSARTNTVLMDVFSDAASGKPIAGLNRNGEIVGVATASDILAALTVTEFEEVPA